MSPEKISNNNNFFSMENIAFVNAKNYKKKSIGINTNPVSFNGKTILLSPNGHSFDLPLSENLDLESQKATKIFQQKITPFVEEYVTTSVGPSIVQNRVVKALSGDPSISSNFKNLATALCNEYEGKFLQNNTSYLDSMFKIFNNYLTKISIDEKETEKKQKLEQLKMALNEQFKIHLAELACYETALKEPTVKEEIEKLTVQESKQLLKTFGSSNKEMTNDEISTKLGSPAKNFISESKRKFNHSNSLSIINFYCGKLYEISQDLSIFIKNMNDLSQKSMKQLDDVINKYSDDDTFEEIVSLTSKALFKKACRVGQNIFAQFIENAKTSKYSGKAEEDLRPTKEMLQEYFEMYEFIRDKKIQEQIEKFYTYPNLTPENICPC